jgi:hypothetical protein
MFGNAIEITVASADDGFSIITATYADGSTVGFVNRTGEDLNERDFPLRR